MKIIFFSVLLAASILAAEQQDFLIGGDISLLTRIEEHDGKFFEDGKQTDPVLIFRNNGWNCFRLRLFVNPNNKDGVVNDLPYTLALAKRIKQSGAKLLLDFHYSDTWADPGKQTKPAAWADLDFNALEKKVEDYTASVITEFKNNDVLPYIVQVGNEIAPGMLWPDGKLYDKNLDPEKQWDQFTRLLKAGIRGVKKPLSQKDHIRIMIHIAHGGEWGHTKWFFDHLNQKEVAYDIIGQSYYPWWHGTLENVRENLQNSARTYKKDIIIVETAYPYRGQDWWQKQKNMAWPISPEGQSAFLTELLQAIKQTPDNRGIGLFYWHPESIPAKGLSIWNGGATALFDNEGHALPAIKALKLNTKQQ